MNPIQQTCLKNADSHNSSTHIALCNHLVAILKRHQPQLEDYESRLIRINQDLRLSISEVTGKIKRLNDQGLAHHLPISA